MIHLESYNKYFIVLFVHTLLQSVACDKLHNNIAAFQMGHDTVRIGWQKKGGDDGTFSYLIRTHLFISHISCSKVVRSWAHPTELQRVTDLEMITKALVDDQLTAFKWLWKDICKVTKALSVN